VEKYLCEIIGWKIPRVHGDRQRADCPRNAGCAIGRDYLRSGSRRGGRGCFVLEYPGYGARAGSPGKKSFMARREAFQLLPAGSPKYVVSESSARRGVRTCQKSFAGGCGHGFVRAYTISHPWRSMNLVSAFLLLLVDRFNPKMVCELPRP